MRINNPDMALALNRLLDRIDALEAAVERMNATVGQVPTLIGMVGDVADEAYRTAANAGINLEERARSGLDLLVQLTAPPMVHQLQQLLTLAEQLPGLLAMTGDVIDDAYRSATNAGIDLENMVKQGGIAAQRLSDLMRSAEFTALMNSGMLDPKAVRLLGSAATALVTSQEKHPQQIGPLGLLGALRDPDIQKALGFFMAFAKEFGKHIG
jgi:uncharacterized protein YjgD (DUF1641 family)